MRSLGFKDDQEVFCHADQDSYATLFTHPLSSAHVQALAALFGWSIPELLSSDGIAVSAS
jgi:hypothetical protein